MSLIPDNLKNAAYLEIFKKEIKSRNTRFVDLGVIQNVRSSFVVEVGGGGFLKSELNKKEEFFLASCLAVAKSFFVLSLVHVFLLKRCRHFFCHLTFFYEHVNIFTDIYRHCMYNCVKNIDLLCWDKNQFFSLFSIPNFLFENS